MHHNYVTLFLQCRAFAKALHYKEMEFEAARSKKMGANPVTAVESLIHINNQLHQHEVSFFVDDICYVISYLLKHMIRPCLDA